MAYISQNQNLEDDKKLLEGGGSGAAPQPMLGSTDGGMLSGTGGNQQADTAKPKSDTSGTWTNLNQYLDANKPQSAQLGSTVAGVVDTRADEARGQMDASQEGSAASVFNTEVDSATVNQDQAAIDAVVNPVSRSGTPLPTQEQIDAFKGQSGAQYSGPDDYSTSMAWKDINEYVGKAEDTGKGVMSSGGRKTILQDDVQTKSKARGVTSLNNLFLQSSPEAREKLVAARDRVFDPETGVGQAAEQFETEANERIEEAKATTEATAKAAQDAAKAAQETWLGDVTGEYQQQVSQDVERVNQARQDAAEANAREDYNREVDVAYEEHKREAQRMKSMNGAAITLSREEFMRRNFPPFDAQAARATARPATEEEIGAIYGMENYMSPEQLARQNLLEEITGTDLTGSTGVSDTATGDWLERINDYLDSVNPGSGKYSGEPNPRAIR